MRIAVTTIVVTLDEMSGMGRATMTTSLTDEHASTSRSCALTQAELDALELWLVRVDPR